MHKGGEKLFALDIVIMLAYSGSEEQLRRVVCANTQKTRERQKEMRRKGKLPLSMMSLKRRKNQHKKGRIKPRRK